MSTILDSVRPPVPDPDLQPKSAAEMADEGDREGPVLTDGAKADETQAEIDPQFARNGE